MDETTTASQQQVPPEIIQLVKGLVEQMGPKGVYANNFHFEPTVWDLKIHLGTLNQQKAAIDWHAAVTIPWLQVKLVAYYLRLQFLWHECQNGQIKIPASVMPKQLAPPSGDAANDPIALAFHEGSKKIYAEMFGPTEP
jgi:hypothetical protein